MILPCTSVNRLMTGTTIVPIIAVAGILNAVVTLSAETSGPPSPPGGHDRLKVVPDGHVCTIMGQSGVAGAGIA